MIKSSQIGYQVAHLTPLHVCPQKVAKRPSLFLFAMKSEYLSEQVTVAFICSRKFELTQNFLCSLGLIKRVLWYHAFCINFVFPISQVCLARGGSTGPVERIWRPHHSIFDTLCADQNYQNLIGSSCGTKSEF